MLMELPIEELLAKYWNGETTLEEEKAIKAHFAQNPSLSEDGKYFRMLAKNKEVSMPAKQRKKQPSWMSAAAVVLIGVATALFVVQNQNNDPYAIEDPERALEMTRSLLIMVGSELNEGQTHTMDLAKINKAKEELEIIDN